MLTLTHLRILNVTVAWGTWDYTYTRVFMCDILKLILYAPIWSAHFSLYWHFTNMLVVSLTESLLTENLSHTYGGDFSLINQLVSRYAIWVRFLVSVVALWQPTYATVNLYSRRIKSRSPIWRTSKVSGVHLPGSWPAIMRASLSRR